MFKLQVIRAAKAGFCFGVKRALDLAEMTAQRGATASFGELIHNRQAVERLAQAGVTVVADVEETAGRTLVIRSHGVPPDIYELAEKANIEVVDATCPYVKKAQQLAKRSAGDGQVVVVGDRRHPEVEGILGWAGAGAVAVETVAEAAGLPFYPRLAVLAQTTQPVANFEAIVAELRQHTGELTVHHTICNATEERQNAAGILAAQVEVMVVAGGRNSANTRKLAAICAKKTPTYMVETADELEEVWFKGCQKAGLTAGASTPDWIIEEVFKKMSEINAQEPAEIVNMDSWDEGLQELHQGAVVTGPVVKMTDGEVFIDIGWKSEGVISLRELSVAPVQRPEDVLAIGDRVTAMVLKVENEEGYPVLSRRRAAEAEAVDRLAHLAETKEEIQAKAVEVVKGGLLVDVGMRGFVPASQVDLGYVEDLSQYVGRTLRLRVIEFDAAHRKVVLSQKAILAEEQKTKRAHLLETLQEGEIVRGTVRRLANFGAFVDIGGVDGLLHVSDMAYSRLKHPSQMVKAGDELEVQVLKVDREAGKISLGLKQLRPSPWSGVAEKYPVSSLVNGKVVRLAPFGAFVQLDDGIDALIHISQLADRRVDKVEDVVKVGDMVSAKVIECRPEEKRISLSIREVIADANARNDAAALAGQPETPAVTIGEALGQPAQGDQAGQAE